MATEKYISVATNLLFPLRLGTRDAEILCADSDRGEDFRELLRVYAAVVRDVFLTALVHVHPARFALEACLFIFFSCHGNHFY